jgi:hypothetical protein
VEEFSANVRQELPTRPLQERQNGHDTDATYPGRSGTGRAIQEELERIRVRRFDNP